MSLDRRAFLLASLGAATAVSGPVPLALAAAQRAKGQVPGLYRFTVGSTQVTAVNDGALDLELDLYPQADREAAERLLERAFLPTDGIPTAVNAFLVNMGDRLILIDAGTGNTMGPRLGRLPENLRAAGVDLSAVDTILLTHLHADHANGLLAPDGTAAFPRAEVVVAEAEYAFWTDSALRARAPDEVQPMFDMAAAALQPYETRLRRITPGGEVVPGITSIAAPGHTPGHTLYRLSLGDGGLLVWGDIVHTAPLQLPHPEWAIAFDTDPAQAVETRKRILDQAAADRLTVAGMHLNFPGVGHVVREGQGYRFVPTFWSPEL